MKYLLPDQTGPGQAEEIVVVTAPDFDQTADQPEENNECLRQLQQAAARGRQIRESTRRISAAMQKVRTRKKQ